MQRDIKFCVNTWIFGKMPLPAALSRAASLGFDGIELLVNEPAVYKPEEVKRLLDNTRLEVFTICTDFSNPKRILSHQESEVREVAVEYMKGCVDLAASVGARSVLVVPGQVGVATQIDSRKIDLQRSIQPLREVAEYAGKRDILLTIEPINRFEANLVHSLSEALELTRIVDHEACRIMGDTFHMQMEEGDGIPNSIRRTGHYWLQHLHASENTRESPGMGTLPWQEIIRALHDIDYEGYISLEPLPKGYQPDDKDIPMNKHDQELTRSLLFLREIQKTVKAYV